MKKITSKEPISFRVDGATLLEIGPKGCLASDAAAAIAKERLGEHITVTETSIKKAVEDAKDSLKPLTKAQQKAAEKAAEDESADEEQVVPADEEQV